VGPFLSNLGGGGQGVKWLGVGNWAILLLEGVGGLCFVPLFVCGGSEKQSVSAGCFGVRGVGFGVG